MCNCSDIDECEGGDHGCSQTCVNTAGSYYCNCQRGFQRVGTTECEGIYGASRVQLKLKGICGHCRVCVWACVGMCGRVWAIISICFRC